MMNHGSTRLLLAVTRDLQKLTAAQAFGRGNELAVEPKGRWEPWLKQLRQ